MDEHREKSFEKRQELIDAALIEFGERGYENASLNNILKEADIGKGTFYYHYRNKEDLYMQLIDIIVEEKLAFISNEMKTIEGNEDIFTKLKIMIKIGMKFAHRNPLVNTFSQSFIKESGTQDHNKRMEKYYKQRESFLEELSKKYGFESTDYVGDLIQEAYRKKELREDLPRNFVYKIINYLLFNLQSIINTDNLEEYEMAANHLVDFLKDGLGNEG